MTKPPVLRQVARKTDHLVRELGELHETGCRDRAGFSSRWPMMRRRTNIRASWQADRRGRAIAQRLAYIAQRTLRR